MKEQVPTPRTDAETYGGKGIIGAGYVSAESSRRLERELATAIKERDEARRDADNLFNHLTYVTEQGLDVGGTCLWLHKDSDSASAMLENARKALAVHEVLKPKTH